MFALKTTTTMTSLQSETKLKKLSEKHEASNGKSLSNFVDDGN